MSSSFNQTLTPKPSNLLAALLLVLGVALALGAATYGYIESRRTEQVLIAVRAVPFGQQIVADDLGTIELPLHRPAQLTGLADPARVLGHWAARTIGANDLLQSSMLLTTAPAQPVYPSGQQLDRDTVPVPFSTATIGPLSIHDVVNIGYSMPGGDPQLCRRDTLAPSAEAPAADASAPVQGRPFACRLLQRVKILDIDLEQHIVYLQMTPYQAHTIWALQAAGVQLWGERYGASSDALPAMDRLEASQIDPARLTLSVSETLTLLHPRTSDGVVPGARSALPGAQAGQ